jgi:hypothetical protein
MYSSGAVTVNHRIDNKPQKENNGKWKQLKSPFAQQQRSRVTRLGKFSPLGQLFTLGIVLKITEVAQFLGYFFPRKHLRINFDKKCLGRILGNFFTNVSGHPAEELQF